jgi:hypothetical protein
MLHPLESAFFLMRRGFAAESMRLCGRRTAPVAIASAATLAYEDRFRNQRSLPGQLRIDRVGLSINADSASLREGEALTGPILEAMQH